MNKSLSSNDKFILSVVVCILIAVAAYYFGYRNFVNMTDQVNAENVALRAKLSELTDIRNSAVSYKEKTEKYKNDFEEAIARYDSGYSDKDTLLFVTRLEAELDVWVRAVSMPGGEIIYKFGNKTSSNPNRVGEKVYSTDMIGCENKFSINFEAKYENFRDILEYIKNYDTKYMVTSLTATYDDSNELVNGNIMIAKYVVAGSNRAYYEPEVESVQTGTPNIFASETNINMVASSDDILNMMTGYDIAISLNSKASDLSSVVVGRRGLTSSQIYNNSNEAESVVITVKGSDGEYYLSYAIGDKNKYPSTNYESGVLFNPGRTLDILVISSSRESADDLASANVSIINQSDMTVNVKVVNDDESLPRFRSDVLEGLIRFYQ